MVPCRCRCMSVASAVCEIEHRQIVVVVAPEGQVRGVLELLGLDQALQLEP